MTHAASPSRMATGIAALALFGPAAAHAEVLMLQNDSFVDGGTVYFQEGFGVGEQGAVTLGPVAETFQVRKIQFLFGPEDTQATITVHVYADVGTDDPGSELHSGDYQVTPSSAAFQEIDLSADNVVHSGPGSIRVGIELQNADLPSLARDEDGRTPEVNWIDGEGVGWVPSSFYSVPGDWIIRAEVDTGGSGTGGSGTGGSGTGGSGTGGSGTGAAGAGTPTACVPGQSSLCVGPGACQGGQVCLPDGSGYGVCECGTGGTNGAAPSEEGGCSVGSASARPTSIPLWLVGLGVAPLLGRRRRRR